MNPAAPQGAVSGLQPSVAVVVLATTAAQIASAMGIAIVQIPAKMNPNELTKRKCL